MKKAKETVYKLGLPVGKIAYAVEVSTETVREWLAELDGVFVKYPDHASCDTEFIS